MALMSWFDHPPDVLWAFPGGLRKAPSLVSSVFFVRQPLTEKFVVRPPPPPPHHSFTIIAIHSWAHIGWIRVLTLTYHRLSTAFKPYTVQFGFLFPGQPRPGRNQMLSPQEKGSNSWSYHIMNKYQTPRILCFPNNTHLSGSTHSIFFPLFLIAGHYHAAQGKHLWDLHFFQNC